MIDDPPDLSALLGAAAVTAELADIVRLGAPAEVVPGWATVDLERAAGIGLPPESYVRDDLLGASAVVVPLDRGRRVVLLEPATEGPLAAALARHGEGWVAAYLRVADPEAPARLRRAGHHLSAERRGPLGPQRRALIGTRDGPFILVVAEA